MNEFELGTSIATRAMSGFPLSIGTSIAFESLFAPRQDPYDPNRELPPHIDILNYSEVYINVSTLFRNLIGAVKKEVFLHSNEFELKAALTEEIDIINSLLNNEGNGVCRPTYYFDNYKDFDNYCSKHKIMLRVENTDYQKYYKDKLVKTLRLLLKETDDVLEYNSGLLPKFRTKSLIISHIPFDLLSNNKFEKLDLLETHTGKLKEKYEWCTKYYPLGDSSLLHLPFNKLLLSLFGDKIHIHPSLYKLRKLIYDISVSRKWTPVTTTAKIKQDFALDVKEHYVLEYLNKL